MLDDLKAILNSDFPFLRDAKLLLAVSGGIDSMVLAAVFKKLNYTISIAHCNFQLRKESFLDQKFVEAFADENAIQVYSTIFDTATFAEDYKVSIQVAARELRYNWFYELANEHGFDYILTAHHADDNIETLLINLLRGTGIDGLIGIPSQNDLVIRPFLKIPRKRIEQFAEENEVEWREDLSNESDKYVRNKIRHHLIPTLHEINPTYLTSIAKTQDYLRQTQQMAEDAAVMVYQQVAQQADDEIHFNLKKLKQLSNYESYLYYWLREFGFTSWQDIYDLVNAESGKQVFSPTYTLLKNREYFIMSPNTENPSEIYYIDENQRDVKVPLKLTIQSTDTFANASNNTIFVDAEKLIFPLQIRRWQEGDILLPIGMSGKSKKVSKLFKDEKLSLNEKPRIWLLCSDEKIIWVIGIRADDRFKVTSSTKNILQIQLT